MKVRGQGERSADPANRVTKNGPGSGIRKAWAACTH